MVLPLPFIGFGGPGVIPRWMAIFLFGFLALSVVVNNADATLIHVRCNEKKDICVPYNCEANMEELKGNNAKAGKQFSLINVNTHDEIDLPKYSSEFKEGNGAFLEDYIIKKVFETSSTENYIIKEIENSTSTPSSSITIIEEPFNFPECQYRWEQFLPGIITEEGRDNHDFAARIGYLELGKIRKEMEGLVKDFLKMTNIEGFKKDYFTDWVAKNDWVHTIQLSHIKYYPVENGTKMMIFCLRCSAGVFGIAPTEFNEENVDKSASIHNWTDDFNDLKECKQKFNFVTEGELESNVYVPFMEQVNCTSFECVVQEGTMYVGIQTDEAQIRISSNQLEAHKYKFGYTNPLRLPELSESANDYRRVWTLGIFVNKSEEGYKPEEKYGITVFFQKLSWGELRHRDFDVSTEEKKGEWANVKVKFGLAQTKYVCPKYTVNMPRLLGYAIINKDGRTESYNLMARRFIISNAGNSVELIFDEMNVAHYNLYEPEP